MPKKDTRRKYALNMRKKQPMKVIALVLFIFLPLGLICRVSSVKAALVTVDHSWNIKINVLSYKTDQAYEVTDTTNVVPDAQNSRLSLMKNGEQVKMQLNGEGVDWSSDVNPTSEEIVEIERSRAPENIKIYSTTEGFNIEQTGFSAKTSLPIIIDGKNKSLAIETKKGSEYLLFLPQEVVQTLQQNGVITDVAKNELVLAETEEGNLYYEVKGTKVINLFKIVDIDVAVNAKLDASNGHVLVVDQPLWLSLFGFMLS